MVSETGAGCATDGFQWNWIGFIGIGTRFIGIGSSVFRDWIIGFQGLDHRLSGTGSRVHRDWIGVFRVKTIGFIGTGLVFSGIGFRDFQGLDLRIFRDWIFGFSDTGFFVGFHRYWNRVQTVQGFLAFRILDFATGVLRFDNTKMLLKSAVSEFFHMLFTLLPG